MRGVLHQYDDPLDLIWLSCAEACGLRIRRSSDVFASYDGAGTLTLCLPGDFDADDSVAQLIFHELCHGLVAGTVGRSAPDWGLQDAEDAAALVQEHACHRLQATLADRYGLRPLFAVTTEHRPYWDSLPLDPLAPGVDPAIAGARRGFQQALVGPWAVPLADALARTQRLAALLRQVPLPTSSLWRWTSDLHVTGHPLWRPERERRDRAETDGTATSRAAACSRDAFVVAQCGDCAWAFTSADSAYSNTAAGQLRCRQAAATAPALTPALQACVRFEPRLAMQDCGRCGACCREGFDRVEVVAEDLFGKRYPQWVAAEPFAPHIPRPKGRCLPLVGDGSAEAPYRCRVYPERPRACREFPPGGAACLVARQRVGLSAGGGPLPLPPTQGAPGELVGCLGTGAPLDGLDD